MHSLFKILLYGFVVLLAGVLISPLAYWGCQWLIANGWSWLDFIKDFPFHRYFSRTIQVAGLVLLVPFIFWLRIRHPRDLGLLPNPHRWSDLLTGLFVALAVFAPMAIGYLLTGVYKTIPDPEWMKLGRIAATAGAVSVLEELFFRGVLLGLAVRAFGAWGGAILSSMIFSGMHFLKPAKIPDTGPVTWTSGWEQAQLLFSGAPDMPVLAYGALTLLVAGLILSAATLRTSSLWLPIGLHAGWIFSQQGFHLVAKIRIKPPEALLPWIGPNVVSGAVPTGLIPVVMLLITGGFVWLYLRRRTS